MTRDEYLAVLATEPATSNQRGAVMRECRRLGLVDRAERLAVLAELAGLEELGSTTDLTQGQGGRLVSILSGTHDRGELPGVAAAGVDEVQADEAARQPRQVARPNWGGSGNTLTDAIMTVMLAAAILTIRREPREGITDALAEPPSVQESAT